MKIDIINIMSSKINFQLIVIIRNSCILSTGAVFYCNYLYMFGIAVNIYCMLIIF